MPLVLRKVFLANSSSRKDEMFIELTSESPSLQRGEMDRDHCRPHCAPLERGSCHNRFYKHLAPLEPRTLLGAAGRRCMNHLDTLRQSIKEQTCLQSTSN